MRRQDLFVILSLVFCAGWLVSCGDDDDGGNGTEDSGPAEAGPKEDASNVPPPTCTTDDDCDDGRFCDGQERCRNGECSAGAPVVCDDGIECTTDTCAETTRECRSL